MGLGIIEARRKMGGYMFFVSSELKRKGKNIYPDIINHASLWVLGAVTVKTMITGERKERKKCKRKRKEG